MLCLGIFILADRRKIKEHQAKPQVKPKAKKAGQIPNKWCVQTRNIYQHVVEDEDLGYFALDEGDYNALPAHLASRVVHTVHGAMLDEY